MKNILIIIASLKHGGGAEKVATTIGSSLYEKGYNIHFLTFYDVKEKYEFKGKYYSFNEKPSKNILINVLKLFVRAYKIKKYCRENDIHISISHMNESNFSNILSKILFKNKSKTIIQIHASLHISSYLYKKIVRYLYPMSDKIITIVEEEKENLINKYNIKKEKIETIFNPIDIEKIDLLKNENVKENENIFIDKKIFSFINIGRLTYQKNQKLLIDVFKIFNKKYKNSQLIILGEGELRKDLEKQIGDYNNIYLLGKQLNPYKFLNKADCFLFTSRYEGFGIVLIEGMACGLPIISTNCKTGPKEILKKENNTSTNISSLLLEEYGILTPVLDKKIIYSAMEKLYLDKNLKEHYQKKSLERSKDFEIKKIIKKWEEIIKNI